MCSAKLIFTLLGQMPELISEVPHGELHDNMEMPAILSFAQTWMHLHNESLDGSKKMTDDQLRRAEVIDLLMLIHHGFKLEDYTSKQYSLIII